MRIYAIGIGDEKDGSHIPITEDGRKTFLMDQGEERWSKLDAKMLQEIALATPGGDETGKETTPMVLEGAVGGTPLAPLDSPHNGAIASVSLDFADDTKSGGRWLMSEPVLLPSAPGHAAERLAAERLAAERLAAP